MKEQNPSSHTSYILPDATEIQDQLRRYTKPLELGQKWAQKSPVIGKTALKGLGVTDKLRQQFKNFTGLHTYMST